MVPQEIDEATEVIGTSFLAGDGVKYTKRGQDIGGRSRILLITTRSSTVAISTNPAFS